MEVRLSKTYGMKVYTEDAEYYGIIEEAKIQENRVIAWVIKPTPDSKLAKIVGTSTKALVEQRMVKAIGDIMIISRAMVPSREEEKQE